MKIHSDILACIDLRKQFMLKGGPAASSGMLTAVDGVSLAVRAGETLGIAGESGCGKSTLGKILAGLIPADSGEIRYDGASLETLPAQERVRFRRQIQMIFQDPYSSLNPRMRVGDIIAEPLVVAGKKKDLRETVEKIMATVGLPAAHYNRFPHEFSGGQRQRIGIARALAVSPRLIIADEPVSSLDVSIQAQIINLLQEMKATFDLSLLIISHDLSVLRHICDRMTVMYLGIIVETAPTAALFERCLHPYTEALISAAPRVSGGTSRRIVLSGDIPSPLAIPDGCRFHTRCPYAQEKCRLEVPPLEEKLPGRFAACHFSDSLYVS